MRVLQLGMYWQTDSSGGVDRIFTNNINFLPKFDVKVLGIVLKPENVASLTEGRIHTYYKEDRRSLKKIMGIRKGVSQRLYDFQPDIVASHFAMLGGAAFGLLKDKKLVTHFHGPWFSEAAEENDNYFSVAAKKFIERQVYSRSNHLIAESQAFKDLVVKFFGIFPDKVTVVPGSVDVARFDIRETKEEARQMLGWPVNRPILVSVRRLSSRMGFDNLIKAVQIITRNHPDVLLHIAGKGALKEILQNQIDASNLQNNVKLLGFVPESQLALVYRAADLNVLPTIALEGFGLAAVESLAAGTPSIVTPIGGLPEVVSGLSEELLFHSTTFNDMAEKLNNALYGSAKLPSPAECSRYAARNFNCELAAERTADVYRSVV